MNLITIGGLVCLVLALVYRVMHYLAKDKQVEQQYNIIAEIYTAATIIISCVASALH